MTDLSQIEPLPGQLSISDAMQERKRYHNLEAGDLCPACNKGKLLPAIASDPANDDVYHFGKCDYCGYTTE